MPPELSEMPSDSVADMLAFLGIPTGVKGSLKRTCLEKERHCSNILTATLVGKFYKSNMQRYRSCLLNQFALRRMVCKFLHDSNPKKKKKKNWQTTEGMSAAF